MTPPAVLSRDLLQALVADLELPAPWPARAAGATAALERRVLITQLAYRLLTATVPARARLRAWLDQHRARPTPAPAEWILARGLRPRVAIYGDLAMLDIVLTALLLVPEPVRAAVVDEVAWFTVGLGSHAWTGGTPSAHEEGPGRPRLIVVSAAGLELQAIVHVCLHEIAHAWLEPRPRAAVATAADEAQIMAEAWWREEGLERWTRRERLAEGLAMAWLHAARGTFHPMQSPKRS